MGLRIGFDARYISDRYHGIGRYAHGLLNALIRLAPEIHFVLFTGKHQDTRFNFMESCRAKNVSFVPGPWPLFWPQEQLQWPFLLRRAQIQLFHTPYFPVPMLARLPRLNTVHDLIFEHYPQYMPGAFRLPYYRLLMKLSLSTAVRTLAVSQATAVDLIAVYRLPENKVRVTLEGVDAHFRPINGTVGARALERYRLDRPYLLTVGVRRPHKNMQTLVQAYMQAAPQLSTDLVFAGPADERFIDQARQQIDASPLKHRIHFLDWVAEEDLPALYSQAKAVVLTSKIEGFGLPALEALACGVPVVAADNPAYAEVIGGAGLLVNPDDPGQFAQAMIHLEKNENLRARLVARGLQQAAQFTWESTANIVLAEYRRLLE